MDIGCNFKFLLYKIIIFKHYFLFFKLNLFNDCFIKIKLFTTYNFLNIKLNKLNIFLFILTIFYLSNNFKRNI